MAKFNLKITNCETGEVLHDKNTNLVIGVFDADDELGGTGAISVVDGVTGTAFVSALVGLELLASGIYEQHPILKIGVDAFKKSGQYVTKVDMNTLKNMMNENPSDN